MWQNTWEKQPKEGKVCLGSQFQRFQLMVTWPHCSGLVLKQNILTGSMWLFTSWQPGGRGQNITFQDMSQWSASSNKSLLLNSPLRNELVDGLIHWWTQTPHDPVTSRVPPLKAAALRTNPSTYESLENISYPNYNTLLGFELHADRFCVCPHLHSVPTSRPSALPIIESQ
jgi:hypothetical protein